MNRIRGCLARLGHKKLLVPFFTAGYPDMETSLELVRLAEDSGADMVELGMPFSDPLADGPEIQHSSYQSLRNNTTLAKILKGVAQLRKTTTVPLILMGYYNPLHAYTLPGFVTDASAAGVDGCIIPDLPVEEARTFRKLLKDRDLSSIFLVAPTSDTQRVKIIDAACTDFVYAVTVTGVTGAAKKFDRSTDNYLNRLNRDLTHPFVAGFGVSSPEDARRMVRYANGVVIGSALIRMLRTARHKKDARRQIGRFLTRVKKTIS